MLTDRQLLVLKLMRDRQEELVYEAGIGYVGFDRVSTRTVKALLRHCAIRLEDGCTIGKFERYTINGTGEKILSGDYSDLDLLSVRTVEGEK